MRTSLVKKILTGIGRACFAPPNADDTKKLRSFTNTSATRQHWGARKEAVKFFLARVVGKFLFKGSKSWGSSGTCSDTLSTSITGTLASTDSLKSTCSGTPCSGSIKLALPSPGKLSSVVMSVFDRLARRGSSSIAGSHLVGEDGVCAKGLFDGFRDLGVPSLPEALDTLVLLRSLVETLGLAFDLAEGAVKTSWSVRTDCINEGP